jgi:hypothetical protein
MRNVDKISFEILKGRNHFGELDINEGIIFKWTSGK